MGVTLKNILWNKKIKESNCRTKTPYEITRKVCCIACKTWDLSKFPSPLYSLVRNPDFMPGIMDGGFDILREGELGLVTQFIEGRNAGVSNR